VLGVPVLRRPLRTRRDGDLADAETVTGSLPSSRIRIWIGPSWIASPWFGATTET
jgi:hypothetical protein